MNEPRPSTAARATACDASGIAEPEASVSPAISMPIHPTRRAAAAPLVVCLTGLGCSAAPPSPPAIAPAVAIPASASPAAASPPERPRCRPEVRGQRRAVGETAEALGVFFDRVLASEDWSDVIGISVPKTSLLIQEIQRLKACPRFYQATSHRTPELSDGFLVFDEPSIGTLQAGFVTSDTGGGRPERIVVDLYGLENSFRAGLTRAELMSFLERSPEWIPSGGAACSGEKPGEETEFSLFRGPHNNVLCVTRGDASRCYEFDANPSGWLNLETTGYDPHGCAIGTNAVVGPDLDLRIVPYRQRPFVPREPVMHVGSAPYDRTSSDHLLPRAWTELPARWREVEPTLFPIRAALRTWEMDREDIGADAPPAIWGSDLFCLRLDGVWRCNARNDDWPLAGRIRVRSRNGTTVASIIEHTSEPDTNRIASSIFLTFARGDGPWLVNVGRFPLGAESTIFSNDDAGDQTELVQTWEVEHEAPLCVRVARARARLEQAYGVLSDAYRHKTRRVAVVYGPHPASLPRIAPRMVAPDPSDPSKPIDDLRGSWRLEGESWKRVSSCATP